MRKQARDLEVGDQPVGYEDLPIVSIDKTTTPGVVYVWTKFGAAAQMIFQHGEYVHVAEPDVFFDNPEEPTIDPYTGYPEGTSVCDNCGKVEHTEAELAECIDSMLGPVEKSEEQIGDELSDAVVVAVLSYLNAGFDGIEDMVRQVVEDWEANR